MGNQPFQADVEKIWYILSYSFGFFFLIVATNGKDKHPWDFLIQAPSESQSAVHAVAA